MALCKLANDILRNTSCGYNLPEITDIYLANFEDIVATSAETSDSGNVITSISAATDTRFYHIQPAKGSASFEDSLVVEDNGTKYRTHNLTFGVTGKYDATRSLNLDNLSLGKYFAVIKTAEGAYIGLGRTVGLEAETATNAGGGDSNGLNVVLTANVAESAYPLSDGAIATVLGN